MRTSKNQVAVDLGDAIAAYAEAKHEHNEALHSYTRSDWDRYGQSYRDTLTGESVRLAQALEAYLDLRDSEKRALNEETI